MEGPVTMATCEGVSIQTFGWPAACAVPEEKSTLPKGLFARNVRLSDSTKKTLVNTVRAIRLLGIVRDANTSLEPSPSMPEVLVMALPLNGADATVPNAVIELIAAQRKSGIVFVCLRETEDGSVQAALAVRRKMPSKAGREPVHEIFATDWTPVGDLMLPGIDECDSLQQFWDAICAYVALDDYGPGIGDVDTAIRMRRERDQLEQDIAKLSKDHARAKDQTKRNAIFKQLQSRKRALADLEAQAGLVAE